MRLGFVRPYAEFVRERPRQHVLFAGLISRIPSAILGFVTLLLIVSKTGSYAAGGLISATIIASGAIAGPLLARIADRQGQRTVLRVCAVIHIVFVAGLLAAIETRLPLVVILATSVVAGATILPIGSFTRARWSVMFKAGPDVRTAFALEAILDEMVWIIGPAVAAFIATAFDPAFGLVLSALCGTVGSLYLASQRSTDTPKAHPEAPRTRFNPFMSVRTLAVLVAGFFVGLTFGVNDVSAVAITHAQGVPELAGIVLGTGAVGSITGGLILGALPDRFSPYRLFLVASALFGLTWSLLMFAPTVYLVICLVFIAGMTVTPYTVASNRAMESTAPQGTLTEALSWVNSCMIAGMALGSWIGGAIVDAAGYTGGYRTVALFAVIPIVIASLGLLGRSMPVTRVAAGAERDC